jgi:hypothetical protein
MPPLLLASAILPLFQMPFSPLLALAIAFFARYFRDISPLRHDGCFDCQPAFASRHY